jgi:predicted transcriptional regulator
VEASNIMSTMTLELSDDIVRALQSLARQTGRSEAALIHEAIEEYLRLQHSPLRSLGLGATETVRARDVESWLEEYYRPTR